MVEGLFHGSPYDQPAGGDGRRVNRPSPTFGFRGWRKPGSGGQPMQVVMRSGETFALVGPGRRMDPESEVVPTCTIIATGG